MARDIKIEAFSYTLPDEKIAKTPLANRSDSKLLVYNKGQIKDSTFKTIGTHLPPSCTLIFNHTKVVSARILFDNPKKVTKAIELFVLEPLEGLSMETAMLQKFRSKWICLIGNYRDFETDCLEKTITAFNTSFTLTVHKPVKVHDAFEVEFEWNTDITFAEILQLVGLTPLPPYMKRQADENDKSRYQTVYAKQEGSVAAPTAGLHFTHDILEDLKKNNITTEYVILHIGAGTFKPVKAETMEDHHMHCEEISVTKTTISHLLKNADNLITVGTTSLRTLESLFWIGLKLHKEIEDIQIHQWDAYDLEIPSDFNYKKALEAILKYLELSHLDAIKTKTQLLIAPGYKIRSIKGIITNFHQPNSTLLLLIAAFVGDDWKNIYEYALNNNYRFLSYGDSSLLLP